MEKRFVNESFVGAVEDCYNMIGHRHGSFNKVGCLVVGYANPIMYIFPKSVSRNDMIVPIFV